MTAKKKTYTSKKGKIKIPIIKEFRKDDGYGNRVIVREKVFITLDSKQEFDVDEVYKEKDYFKKLKSPGYLNGIDENGKEVFKPLDEKALKTILDNKIKNGHPYIIYWENRPKSAVEIQTEKLIEAERQEKQKAWGEVEALKKKLFQFEAKGK